MLTKEVKTILEQIEKQKEIIAKARDDLREIQNSLETELETFDQGLEDLGTAIDLFSEHV